mmetsp:Transcript_5935/g.10184  ORF Transcript_5935/g.10184 Transcript_5935/m.10184 type:complete len:362 (+) Transcript_5935:321-1406(+)
MSDLIRQASQSNNGLWNIPIDHHCGTSLFLDERDVCTIWAEHAVNQVRVNWNLLCREASSVLNILQLCLHQLCCKLCSLTWQDPHHAETLVLRGLINHNCGTTLLLDLPDRLTSTPYQQTDLRLLHLVLSKHCSSASGLWVLVVRATSTPATSATNLIHSPSRITSLLCFPVYQIHSSLLRIIRSSDADHAVSTLLAILINSYLRSTLDPQLLQGLTTFADKVPDNSLFNLDLAGVSWSWSLRIHLRQLLLNQLTSYFSIHRWAKDLHIAVSHLLRGLVDLDAGTRGLPDLSQCVSPLANYVANPLLVDSHLSGWHRLWPQCCQTRYAAWCGSCGHGHAPNLRLSRSTSCLLSSQKCSCIH